MRRAVLFRAHYVYPYQANITRINTRLDASPHSSLYSVQPNLPMEWNVRRRGDDGYSCIWSMQQRDLVGSGPPRHRIGECPQPFNLSFYCTNLVPQILSYISGYRLLGFQRLYLKAWQGAPLSKFHLFKARSLQILFQRRSLAGGSLVQVPTLQGSVSSHSLPTTFFGRGLPCPNCNSSRLENISRVPFQRRSLVGGSLVQIATLQERLFQHFLASHSLAGGSR